MWCIAKITAEYRTRMYDLLDLYAEGYDPKKPMICVDEKSKQLLKNKRDSIPVRPGHPAKEDSEYERNGTRNIFVAVEPKGGRHLASVTRQRKKPDFAKFIKGVVDDEYPDADLIRIVLDNLNTHVETSFTETFSKEEAKRLLKKVQFHYTPKHASWLNMAEIEIGILDTECLGDRRVPDEQTLVREVVAWVQRRNKEQKKIVWKFTKQDADKKLSKYYVP